MTPYGFNINVLHKFLDTARAYLDLARMQTARPRIERRQVARLQASRNQPHLAIEYRDNAPA